MPSFFRSAALAILIGGVSLPAITETRADADTVLARVGETEITLGHAIALRGQLPPQFQQIPPETLFPAIVEQLIDQELLRQSGTDELGRRDRLMLDNEVRNFISNAAMTAALADLVTEEAIASAYEAFAAEFAEGEPETEYNAAHILVETEEEIAAVVARLEAGEDFADVAREVSRDGSAAQGGDLGWFGAGVMIAPFEQAVMALEPGQVSGPVQTRFGWHVVRLIDSRVASVPPLEEVREQLLSELQQEAAQAVMAELRAGTDVENLSDGVDPALLGDATLLDD